MEITDITNKKFLLRRDETVMKTQKQYFYNDRNCIADTFSKTDTI